MDKQSILKPILYVVLYLAVFMLLLNVFQLIAVYAFSYLEHINVNRVFAGMKTGRYSSVLVVGNVFSSLTTIVLFARLRWAVVTPDYLRSKPFGVMFWAAMLSLGSILPLEFIYEKMQLTMPEGSRQLFEGVMKESWGYLVIGVLVPVAEEFVFRGAILRSLLGLFGKKWTWLAIALSALIFGAIHFNMAQGLHAFVAGIVLGWMYARTSSVVPGIVFHWVNNTVAYLIFNLMPQMSDGQLIDLFYSNDRVMMASLLFSLCILVPALFQLAVRMKRAA